MSNAINVSCLIDHLAECYLDIPGINPEDVELARLRAYEQLTGLDLSAFQTAIMLIDDEAADQSTGYAPHLAQLGLGLGFYQLTASDGDVQYAVVGELNGEVVRVLVEGRNQEEAYKLARRIEVDIHASGTRTIH